MKQKSLKVLVFGKYLPPFRGGIERFTHDLCTNLKQNGIDVSLWAIERDGATPRAELKYKFTSLTYFGQVFSQPLFVPNFSHLKTEINSADLIILNYPNPLGDFYMQCLGSTKAKRIVVFHSEVQGRALLSPLLRLQTESVLKMADKVVIASPQMKKALPLENFTAKVQIIPFGTTLSKFSDRPESDYILFVGRLVPYKGLKHLVEAMSSTSVKLKIVGTGPLEPSVKRWIRRRGLEDRIELLGEVSDEKLQQLYKHCRFLVLPSIAPSETFGICLIEAMAHGKPVITTKLETGVNYVNLDQKTGLCVTPSDSAALAQAINRLLQHPEWARQLGHNAHKRCENLFSRSLVDQQWLHLIQTLLKPEGSQELGL